MLYCSRCGTQIPEEYQFCSHCGSAVNQPSAEPAQKEKEVPPLVASPPPAVPPVTPAPVLPACAAAPPRRFTLARVLVPVEIGMGLVVLVLGGVLLFGGSRPGREPAPVSAGTPQSAALLPVSEPASSVSAPDATASATTTPDGLLQAAFYTNGVFGLQLPESWVGNCAVRTMVGNEGMLYQFYEPNNDAAGFGGMLFTVEQFWDTSADYTEYPSYQYLAESEAGAFIALFPTDVQWNPEDAALETAYRTLENDVADVVASFGFITQ